MNVKHHYRGIASDAATEGQRSAVKASIEDNAEIVGWPAGERLTVCWYVAWSPGEEQCRQHCVAHTNMPMDSAVLQYTPDAKNVVLLRLDLDSLDTYDRVAMCMGELAAELTKEKQS
jgi:hypothetical protein